ncbi:hypothetical protein P8452_08827 [Trifolium repens]|nr:hypothetical protein P8452_08827 [Trifolium repens]
MSPRDLLDADRAPAVLEKYLKDMSTLTPAQRVQFLEKARARKAQAEKEKASDTVDALTQLEIGEEKAKWESENDGLEATIGEQYEEGFQLALDQVKVLFPDIDKDLLGKADAMLVIDGGKLVSPAPAEIVQDSPDNETSTKESPDEASPAEE